MSATIVQTFSKTVRVSLITFAALAAAQSLATPASAGLLDFLFARPQQQHFIFVPAPDAPVIQKPVRRIVREEPRGPRPYVAPEVVDGPVGRFLRDPSLRRGDVVATPDGLMVFQGRGGSTNHKASDFIPVARMAGVNGARRADLINLDRTVRAQSPNVEFIAETSQPKTLVIAKRAQNDARASERTAAD
jgi:hypothetical protein